MATSAYALLGVARTATIAEIRAAYRALAKRYHPDVAGPTGESRFLEIRAAYELIADPDRRQVYDASPEDGQAEAELIAVLRRRRNERRRQRLMRLY